MRLTVIGNPDNRRVMMFRAAARAAELDDPEVIAWQDVACGRSFVIAGDSLVRLESPGEDAEVDRLIRGADHPAENGEIVGLADWHRGFGRALERVADAASATGARLLNDPDDILVMFDKRACHRRLDQAGVPVPESLPSPGSYTELRQSMADRYWRRVFVKSAHGSSSSGVLALQTDGRHRVRADTSVERVGRRLFNSLRVRTYTHEADIASIVDILAPDGLHVERWFPKAGLAGRIVDLRLVVIAGRVTHAVVRASRGPMTNLHLGNQRGDLTALRTAAGSEYDAAVRTCEQVAACFPGSLQVGVDLMFSPDFRRHAVAEVNAFGDLLPGLVVDGRDTYARQIEAMLCRT
jgi:glutathione synthase/RimK-type ligase-like ATP-grasp enzyme